MATSGGSFEDMENDSSSDCDSPEPVIESNLNNDKSAQEWRLNNLQSVSLDFEIPPLHESQCIKNFPSSVMESFRQKGIKIKTGKFLKRENDLIEKNFKDFINTFNPSDPTQLLGIDCERKREIQRYRQETNFFVRLARGLNDRTIRSVYYRAKKMFHPKNYCGNFTEEEDKKLLSLNKKYGNDWIKISHKMNRHHQALLFRYRILKNNRRIGKWKNKEEAELEDSMKTVLNIESFSELDSGFKNLPWEEIHPGVPTRNFMQCRSRWMHVTAWASKSERQDFTDEDRMLLIMSINEGTAEEDSEIDFEGIYEKFFPKVPSIEALQFQWYRLKHKVPNYHLKTMEEILHHLDTNYIPKLIMKGK